MMNDPDIFQRVTTDRLGLTFETLKKFHTAENAGAISSINKIMTEKKMNLLMKINKGYGTSGFFIPVNK